MDISTLRKGDTILVRNQYLATAERRIVVRVIDTDGARGGIVDTKPEFGRYSRSSGFRLGDEIIGLAR